MQTFKEKLAFGFIGESEIAHWLRRRGFTVMPAYEKELNTGKGPRIFAPNDEIIAPDMLAIRPSNVAAGTWVQRWVEAKTKHVFSWHRISGYWTTGIDIRHYTDYCYFQDMYRHSIWVLFLHLSDAPDPRDIPYCPPHCPTGLFGAPLRRLRHCESHRSDKYGRSGMVYWRCDDLILLATLAEVRQTMPRQSLDGAAKPRV